MMTWTEDEELDEDEDEEDKLDETEPEFVLPFSPDVLPPLVDSPELIDGELAAGAGGLNGLACPGVEEEGSLTGAGSS